ncbi:hypothetical protein J1605_023424 [Eschrichtius robustus]|uniref:Uncharacterized protein n=1 Tax=Eschrichtius robustus TaxID=9764 RepID=A0AB34H520_ESCRO|nr:hypothetical protein J1605_023424 [Eschrichtius robustus]
MTTLSCQDLSKEGLWGLVNNTSISMPTAPSVWLTNQDSMKILDVNLLGVIKVTLSLLSLVRKAFVGKLLSKFLVSGWTWKELSYFGVKVAMIEAGNFKTFVTSPEAISQGLQAAWDQASP